MLDRVDVQFFHADRDPLELAAWSWSVPPGAVPAVGDHVVSPTGLRWLVVLRTWEYSLQWHQIQCCNILVREQALELPNVNLSTCETCSDTGELKCMAHVAGDGCEDLVITCPDCSEKLLNVD